MYSSQTTIKKLGHNTLTDQLKIISYRYFWLGCIALLLGLIYCGKQEEVEPGETILVKIGDKSISVNEFIRRAEYTVRPPYKDPNLSIEKRVADLLRRMTLEEKFWQLFMIPGDLDEGKEKYKHGIFGFQVFSGGTTADEKMQLLKYSAGITAKKTAEKINAIQRYFVEETRLGIPIIPFDEALHGLIREGATAFPQSIGLAASWDTELMARVSTAIARETKSRGYCQILSPVVNIARDMRWGRVEETYGEDPYLAARMGVAFVKSFEDMGVITTPKHFVANLGDGGRDSYPIHFNERLLKEVYFPAFKACIQEGGATSIMTSYNSLDGTSCSSNDWLLRKILKDEWGFEGFVISDACAVGGAFSLHLTEPDFEQSGKSAIQGGLDVLFQSAYEHHELFEGAVLKRLIDESVIDEAVQRVLRAKFKLGLFENPYVDPNEAERLNGHPEHRKIALEAARKSIVLLKNENKILPLKKDITLVAVIGQDAIEARLGGYSGPGIEKISILEGIKNNVSKKTKVVYTTGCRRESHKLVTISREHLRSAKDENRGGLSAEYFDNIQLSGEPVLRRNDPQIDFHWTFIAPDPKIPVDWYSIRWTGKLISPVSGDYLIGIEGNDGFRLYIDEKLLIENWLKQSHRTDMVPFHFEKNHAYDIRLEFYENVGNARIRLVWNVGIQDVTEEIRKAVQIAKKADVAIVVIGIEEGEARDRSNLNLPGRQEELIRKVAATGSPIVVVLIGGSAVTMQNWIDQVPAILDAWYPGEEGGNAVADVLFGDYNPGGKLPITFPVDVAQLPLFYNHKPTGRGDDYRDLSGQPLFPFGHGLSYTIFEYSDLEITPSTINPDENSLVTFQIKNAGKVKGDEVVQLYIKDMLASVARPVMELKGFRRITLKPGETKKVSFELTPDHLSLLDKDLNIAIEPGDFKIMIGSSSRDIRLRAFLYVQE